MRFFSKIFLCTLMAFAASFAETNVTRYEAEDAIIGDGAAINGEFVSLNGGYITFDNIEVEKAGKYTITFRYLTPYSDREEYIEVNGSWAVTVHFNQCEEPEEVSSFISLKAGKNSITIKKYWGWTTFDYIEISPYISTVPDFDLDGEPVTPNPTTSAAKLYNFLASNFGKKTISGVMTGSIENYSVGGDVKSIDDVQSVYSLSGKFPALVGFDFGFSTGKESGGIWQQNRTAKVLDLAENLWKQGGIPEFSWHWRDPSQVTANYNPCTISEEDCSHFDFTTGFKAGTTEWDTTSATYKALIRDIDIVADYFLGMQEKGIAAIFRPLHEAGGPWFWWSTHTGHDFTALFRLVYDRMVNVKGVRNLVWVLNPSPQDADVSWNPGEAYFDILGDDLYTPKGSHGSIFATFEEFKSFWSNRKILAMSELSPIPDIDNMVNDEAVWSYWMVWNGNQDSTSTEVWKKNMEDSRVITLEDMPGWDKYSIVDLSSSSATSSSSEAATQSSSSEKTQIFASAVPRFRVTAINRSILLEDAPIGAPITVFDMQGHLLFKSIANTSSFAFHLQNAGIYLLQVGSQVQKLQIR